MPEKNEAFPNGFEAVVLVVATFLIRVFVTTGLHDVRGLLELDAPQRSALADVIAYGVLMALLMQFKGLSYRRLFHSSTSSAATTLVLLVPPVLMLIPALLIVMGWLQEVLQSIAPLSKWEEAAFSEMASGTLASVVIVCLIAPVVEEMLFRGVILRGFLHRYTRWHAIAASSIVFGVAHMNLYQFVGATLIGLLLGWLYERSKSLIPCIALHMAYNTAVTAAATDTLPSEAGLSLGSVVIGLTALALAIAGAKLLRRLLVAKAVGDT